MSTGTFTIAQQDVAMSDGSVVSLGATSQAVTYTSAGGPPPPPPGGTTTWDQAHQASVTLSNGALTATQASQNAKAAIRSTTSKSTEKVHAELTCTKHSGAGNWSIGLVNAAFPIGTDWLGQDSNGLGLWDYSPVKALLNGSTVFTASSGSIVNGDVIALEIDFSAKTLKYQNLTSGPGAWSSAISFASIASGPYFLAFMAWDAGNAVTANFGGSAFAAPVSSGYSAWG